MKDVDECGNAEDRPKQNPSHEFEVQNEDL